MSKTAVGLFPNPGTANEVVRDLVATSFRPDDVRIVREQLDMGVADAMSTPRIDFEVRVERELRDMGATASEANAYAAGLRRGGALVFATGSKDDVTRAGELMNRHGAMEMEELRGRGPDAALAIDDDSLQVNAESSNQVGRIREGGGARVFVW
jgi:hypothetical protein